MGESVTGSVTLGGKKAGTSNNFQIVVQLRFKKATDVVPKLAIEAMINSFARTARDCGLEVTITYDGQSVPIDMKF